MAGNLLAQETSPYLLQHKDNPVDWRPYGPEVFEFARREDKPILLSIGYAACHWCHVMAHESFESPAIAELMNRHFISVKVDREERPDVDAIYQTALALMGQHGGWPLTMFLTPDGKPFWGGTYFPPTSRYGRPGFPDVLNAVAESYARDRSKILANVAAIEQAMAKLAESTPADTLAPTLIDGAALAALRVVDPIHGGTLGAPKFPQVAFFRSLWRAFRRTGSPLYRDAVVLTLERMCQGGIYDHLAGGFARYATDELWLVPHFEKMLYDNAQLIELLTEVWQGTRTPLFAERVRETVGWMLSEMGVFDGDGAPCLFASAFDADSEGEEGRYYVWTEAEIDALLGADAAAFKATYDVTAAGNWEGSVILNRRCAPYPGDEGRERLLARCRSRLLEARRRRTPPLRDDKALADWNGLAIAALAFAGAAFDEAEWIRAAERVFAFARERMTENGRLRHSWRDGRLRHPATLDDHASMARAALVLFEATGQRAYRDAAAAWVDAADRHFRDPKGGYFLSADDTRDVIVRTKNALDNATPSGNGMMAEALARLYLLTGEQRYRARATELIRAFARLSAEQLAHASSLLFGYELLERAVQIVIIGRPDDPDARALRRAAFAAPIPTRVLSQIPPGDRLAESHPAFGKGQKDGRATAYVCVGTACGLPVLSEDALRERLAVV